MGYHNAQPTSLYRGTEKYSQSSFKMSNVDLILVGETMINCHKNEKTVSSSYHTSMQELTHSVCALQIWRRSTGCCTCCHGRSYPVPCITRVQVLSIFSAIIFLVAIEVCQDCSLSPILYVHFMERIPKIPTDEW